MNTIKLILNKISTSLKIIFQRKDFWGQLIIASIMVFIDVYYVRIPMLLVYAVFIIFIATIVSTVKALFCKEKIDYKYKIAVVLIYILFLVIDCWLIVLTNDYFGNYIGIRVLN